MPKRRPVLTIVLIDRLHAMAMRMVDFMLSSSNPWKAVHVSIDPERTAELQRKWKQRLGDLPLEILESPFRSLTQPLLAYVRELRRVHPDAFIQVVLGNLVLESYWEQALHENSALIVELALRHVDGIVITSVPFHRESLRVVPG